MKKASDLSFSPNLSSSDFFLFNHVQRLLSDRVIEDPGELLANVYLILSFLDRECSAICPEE
jgi:hypothetical protein